MRRPAKVGCHPSSSINTSSCWTSVASSRPPHSSYIASYSQYHHLNSPSLQIIHCPHLTMELDPPDSDTGDRDRRRSGEEKKEDDVEEMEVVSSDGASGSNSQSCSRYVNKSKFSYFILRYINIISHHRKVCMGLPLYTGRDGESWHCDKSGSAFPCPVPRSDPGIEHTAASTADTVLILGDTGT